MDKQTHTKFNLNNFLMAFSSALDNTVKNNKHNVKYSSKSLAYIAIKIASALDIQNDIKSDIFSYCIICKNDTFLQNLDFIPFNNKKFLDDTNVAFCVNIASFIIDNIQIQNNTIINEIELNKIIKEHHTIPSNIKDIFHNISQKESFWYDIMSNQIAFYILNELDDFTQEILFDDLIQFTAIVHDCVYNYTLRDYKDSCIDFKAYALSNYFQFENKDKARFIIASHLHNLGLLFIPLNIINKDNKLHHSEYHIIKQIPYFTNSILQQIFGFDDIAKLCYTYCEKINSSGYPNKVKPSNLSLKQRALAALSAYQSLGENRPYREAYTKEKSIEILYNEHYDEEIIKIITSLT